jgi:hypothetical protein
LPAGFAVVHDPFKALNSVTYTAIVMSPHEYTCTRHHDVIAIMLEYDGNWLRLWRRVGLTWFNPIPKGSKAIPPDESYNTNNNNLTILTANMYAQENAVQVPEI